MFNIGPAKSIQGNCGIQLMDKTQYSKTSLNL